MSFSNYGRLRPQVRFLQRQFLQDGKLPFTNVLSERTVEQALKALNVAWLDRVYSPLVTLWIFLEQVLSQGHSCRAAVARLIAHRVSQGLSPCSAETGAYCQARKRLPEKFYSDVARKTGQALHAKSHERWLWNGCVITPFRHVRLLFPISIQVNDLRRTTCHSTRPHERAGQFSANAEEFALFVGFVDTLKNATSARCM